MAVAPHCPQLALLAGLLLVPINARSGFVDVPLYSLQYIHCNKPAAVRQRRCGASPWALLLLQLPAAEAGSVVEAEASGTRPACVVEDPAERWVIMRFHDTLQLKL